MSDLVRTVAAVFVRKSAAEVSPTAFKHALSLDLRWFSPAEARRVLMHAADVGLVTVDADAVTPTFDVKRVRVPVDFRPTPGVLEERPEVPAAAPADGSAAGQADAPDAPAEPDAASAAPPESLVDRLIKDAAAATMEDVADVRRAFEDEKARRAGVLDDEVVALVIARRHGVDVTAHAERLLGERAAPDA